jgi:hypothetical protein
MNLLDELWADIELDACASDGPIKDGDVHAALQRGRIKIENAARQLERDKINAMRLDFRTIPHGEFRSKWYDWRDYNEVLPSYCGCSDCMLWRSGS